MESSQTDSALGPLATSCEIADGLPGQQVPGSMRGRDLFIPCNEFRAIYLKVSRALRGRLEVYLHRLRSLSNPCVSVSSALLRLKDIHTQVRAMLSASIRANAAELLFKVPSSTSCFLPPIILAPSNPVSQPATLLHWRVWSGS